MDQNEVEVHKMRSISNWKYLDRTSLVNKGFIIWHSTPSWHFRILLCVCRFLLQNVLKLINIFLFFVFISLTLSVFSFSEFHPDREITENLFTITENILRTLVHPLGLRRNVRELHRVTYLIVKKNSYARFARVVFIFDISQTFSFFLRCEMTCFAVGAGSNLIPG